MALPDYHKANFDTIIDAADAGQLALLEATNQAGEPVALICAINYVDGEYQMIPLAQMIEGNPFELFTPPEGLEDSDPPTPEGPATT